MSNKGTIRIKENGQIIDYYPRTTYDNVFNENGDNLSTDITQLKTFKDTTETKLENISQNATKTEQSSVNGNIIINDEEVVVYTHPTNAGNKHIPSGGSSGQILGWSADGTAKWVNNSTATTSSNGLMSSTDKTKLDGIETGANKYVHPTTSGNKHIPVGGSSGQILRWAADGVATWGNESTVNIGVATQTSNGLMSSTDKTKLDGIADGANKYVHPTGDGNAHIPVNGTGNNGKFLQATATAGSYQWASLPTASTNVAGIVQLNDTTSSTSTTTAATANAVKTAYDLAASKANASHGNHVPATQTANNAVFLRNDNTWQTVSPDNIGASRGSRVSAVTPATANWYRIAQSGADIGNNIGTFHIRAAASGLHSSTIIHAGISYGLNPTLQQLSHTRYSGEGISKVRIVYHTTYAGNRAYLEVYVPDATARTIEVQSFGSLGWTLLTPSTEGSIPSGYTSKEMSLAIDKIIANINGTVNGFSIDKSVPSNAVFTDTVYTHPNDSNTRHVTDTEKNTWNAKASTAVATSGANGLMSSVDKSKLDGIEASANNYVHPSSHPASIITQDTSNRFVTDAEKNTWNAKASTAVATTSANGLMSTAMVTKLNGIATNANNYSHPTSSGNKHVPSGGSSGQYLGWSADGTAKWSELPAIPSNLLNGKAPGSLASIDIDPNAIAGDGSIAFGMYCSATARGAVAIGSGAVASGEYSVSIGEGTASGMCSVAQGTAKAIGDYSHAEGISSEASGYYSHAEGFITKATGNRSHSQGQNTEARGGNAHAEGKASLASGEQAHAEGENTVASGLDSHAQGYGTTASGDYSHAEGYSTQALAAYAHAEGSGTVASVYGTHAEGLSTKAGGYGAHAEGSTTEASGNYSHAEGQNTIASKDCAHAEGWKTTASGSRSHAEGSWTNATGVFSHAQGSQTTASGDTSCAIGTGTTASGVFSYTAGRNTTAETYLAYVIGTHNKVNTGYTGSYNVTNNAFVIGNGSSSSSLSNAFRVTYSGAAYGLSAFNSSGADYAEYFEWLDGNPDNEDRIGRFVTLEGEKIKLANSEDDYIIGIISGNQSIIGNASEDSWNDMYIRDEFDRLQFEDVEVEHEKYIEDEETGELISTSVNVIEKRIKLNPEYDPDTVYLPRSQRKEWGIVGMLGQIKVIDDGTCKVNGYCKPSKDGIATHTDDRSGYRVIKRINKNLIKVIMK